MRVTARAAALTTAVGHAKRSADPRTKIDVLGTMLLRADGSDSVEILGHSLERCHVATCVASVHEAGAAAVSAERLAGVLSSMPESIDVTLATTDTVMTVSAGRSRYRFATLPAGDFPKLLEPSNNAASFTLSPADAAVLLGVAVAADHEVDRVHLRGVHVHTIGGKIATAAANGVALMLRTSRIEAPVGLQPFTIPNATAAEIVRMARRSAVTIVTDGRVVEARAGRDRFSSKLIDGAFPDYQRVIPPAAAATATVDAVELHAALTRLGAASTRGDGNPAVGLMWSDGSAVALCLARENGTAADSIAATAVGSARIAVAVAMLGKLIEAAGAAQVRLSAGESPGAVLRIDGGDATAIIAPIYWPTRPEGPLGN